MRPIPGGIRKQLMKHLLRLTFLLVASLTAFGATPFEYFPVKTNMTIFPIGTINNRTMGMLGGLTTTNDGYGGFFIFDTNSTATVNTTNVFDRSLRIPTNTTFTAGSGTLGTGTYYYRVTALNSFGETTPSAETSLAITGPAGVNVNWDGVPGATGYKVYGRSTGAELLIAQVGQVTTYLDNGSITPSGAMPGSNTTAGGGRWLRLLQPFNGPSDLNFDQIQQIANNSILGNFTGATADIQVLTSITSANLAQILSNETGTGVAVFSDSPTFTTQITTPSAIVTSLTPTRLVFVGSSDELVDDADMTFATDTLTVTKIIGSTSITDSALTATRVTFAGTGGLLSDDADMTFATDTLTVTKLIGSTSITDSALTATRVTFAGTGGLLSDDSDMTFSTDTLTATKLVAPTSVSTPSIITASGALSVASNSGVVDINGVNVDTQIRTTADTGIAYISFLDESSTTKFRTGYRDSDSLFRITAGTSVSATTGIIINSSGNVGVGTSGGLGTFSVNGGVHIGGDSDAGDNNLTVDGLTTTATLTVTGNATFSNTTASRAAALNASKVLVSADTTLTELNYVSGVTSAIQTQLNVRVREPQYGTSDPNFAGATGDDDGQMFVNTSTGERWFWYATGSYWLP